jgi:MFS transporter, DHA2 family, methylenomycin A resistance protein
MQRRAATLAATSLGFGVIQLDVTVVNVAVERIGHSLHATVTELQWIVSAHTLTFAALILTAGALGDHFGAKRVFSAGFAGFTAAAMACGLAPDTAVLIAARALQGVGAALLGTRGLHAALAIGLGALAAALVAQASVRPRRIA